MRLFNILSVLITLIFASESFAQQFYANASAGYSAAAPGSGAWGGAQACPYPSGGGSGGMTKLEQMVAQRDELDERIDTLETEQEEIIDGDHDIYGDDDIPMSSEIREGLVTIIESEGRGQTRIPCRAEPADAWAQHPAVPAPVATMIGKLGVDPIAFGTGA